MGIAINGSNRESNAYIGTFDVECADDMLQIEEVRAMVRNMNKALRQAKMDYQFRVCLRGRKPYKKGTCAHWLFGKATNRSYDFGGNIIGGLANASKIDAYIYRR